MQTLTSILLINWYRFDVQEFELRGHTAIVGPNGAGKSSILDAIQTVLLGYNKHHVQFNAGADNEGGRSRRDHQRSLRAYCLGEIRDPDNPDKLQATSQPRKEAYTYLVLVYEDQNGKPTTVGMHIHASQSSSDAPIRARFVVPGYRATRDDFLEEVNGSLRPLPWERVQPHLQAQNYHFVNEKDHPVRFVRQTSRYLNNRPEERYDPEWFARNFKSALAFEPIRDVSQFVRRYLLEPNPVDIQELQESLGRYWEIYQKMQGVKDRIESLEGIAKTYREARDYEQRAANYRIAGVEAYIRNLENQLAPLEEALGNVEDQLEALRKEEGRLEEQQGQIGKEIEGLRHQMAQTEAASERERLEALQSREQDRINGITGWLHEFHKSLLPVNRLVRQEPILPRALLSGLHQTQEILPAEGLLQDAWPEDPEIVIARLEALTEAMAQGREEIGEANDTTIARRRALEEEGEDLKRRIKRLEEGKSDLDPATIRMMDRLEAEGISAEPLCDLVDVTDEDWRNAIETFLGGAREILVVPPEQAEAAVEVYRNSDIYGVRVANTHLLQGKANKDVRGSLAEVVEAEDPNAWAVIVSRLGHVMRVSTSQELRDHWTAMTVDGMMSINGEFTRRRPVPHKLGASRDHQLQDLRTDFQQKAEAVEKARREEDVYTAVLDDLRILQDAIDRRTELRERVKEWREAQAEIDRLEEQKKLLDTGEYDRLAKMVEERETKRSEIQSLLSQNRSHQGEYNTSRGEYKGQIRDLEARIKQERGNLENFFQHPLVDRNTSLEVLEKLEGECSSEDGKVDYEQAQNTAERRSKENQGKARGNRERGTGWLGAFEALKEHIARFSGEDDSYYRERLDFVVLADPENTNFLETAEGAQGLLKQDAEYLRSTEMAKYTKKAEEALQTAQATFQHDFIGKIQDNLEKMKGRLRELNRTLEDRPFHGRYYTFRSQKSNDPDCRAVLKLVDSWTPEMADMSKTSLFDPAQVGDAQTQEALQRVREILEGTDGDQSELLKKIQDYRQYYQFDIDIEDPDGTREPLSRRLGAGSGGEHQVPFYVAIGSALASAYQIHETPDGWDAGLRLAVFDEAFNKLDPMNAMNAMSFFDGIGLQVILAAPMGTENYLEGDLDTVIYVRKDSRDVVSIDHQHMTEDGQNLLRGDVPITPTEIRRRQQSAQGGAGEHGSGGESAHQTLTEG
ncbi:SbcC/MukB-like Walker B domain-containing protein [Thiohalorhabdus sp. Cl-TMA]|uniref:SbcC/MukB-like Walker B domain-containing protein n=1 Tax=Thiohalorhabdus methylotrophus TaxID=3242694 RepID=A0ABV4TUQ5_9GAMM